MDKTGTLTEGVFHVEDIFPEEGFSEKELIEYAAMAENYSNHPISQSLKEAYGKAIDESLISGVEELAGKGVTAEVKGHKVAAGNKKLMADKTDFEGQLKEHSGGTQVYVAVDGKYARCV